MHGSCRGGMKAKKIWKMESPNLIHIFSPSTQWSPAFLHQRPVSWKTVFPWARGQWGECFGKTQVHSIYCALYCSYYCIVIYNEIVIQLAIIQNQWEPWACFPATRKQLRVTGDSGSHSPGLAAPLQLHLRSWGVRFLQGVPCKYSRKCDSLGFALLWESNASRVGLVKCRIASVVSDSLRPCEP